MSPKALRLLQRSFNNTLFGGKLRLIPVRQRQLSSALGQLIWEVPTGFRKRIVIDSGTPDHHQLWILVHEMTHQWEHMLDPSLNQDPDDRLHHSKRFKRKLRSIHKKLGWEPPPRWSMRG